MTTGERLCSGGLCGSPPEARFGPQRSPAVHLWRYSQPVLSRVPHALLAGLLLLFASSAHAQVKEGSFRLFVDADLFNAERTVFEKSGQTQVDTRYDFGPGGSAIGSSVPGYVGLGLGYAVLSRVVPSLHFSFARHVGVVQPYASGVAQQAEHDPTISTFMLRPELEVPLNPKSKVVLGVQAAFDFRTFKQKQELGQGAGQYSRTVSALGPMAGLIMHFFVAEQGSVDVSGLFLLDFIDAEGDGPFTDAVNYYSIAGVVTVGISLWP